MQQPAAEYVNPALLKPWAKNPRKNDPAVDAAAESIRRFGWGAPVLARHLPDGSTEIIAGHTRIKAAIKLKLTEVPVRWMDHLSDNEAHALALADNKIGELAEWDVPELASILRDLEADGEPLDGLGWSGAEIDAIIKGAGAVSDDEWGAALGGLPEGDRAPIQTMTFTLHDEQAEQVKAALAIAKDLGPFVDTGNENSNGNALARICEMWAATHGR